MMSRRAGFDEPRDSDAVKPVVPIALVLALVMVMDLGLDLVWVLTGSLAPSWRLFTQVGMWWVAWAVLVPVMAALAARTRPERIGWPAVIGLHTVIGVAVAFLQAWLAAVLFLLPGVAEADRVTMIFPNLVERFGVASFAIYLAAVGASLALRDFHRAQAARLTAVADEQRAAELEARLASADLDAVSGDLHPEVISSAFSEIAELIRSGRSNAAVREIAALGDQFRESLDNRPGTPDG